MMVPYGSIPYNYYADSQKITMIRMCQRTISPPVLQPVFSTVDIEYCHQGVSYYIAYCLTVYVHHTDTGVAPVGAKPQQIDNL